MDPVILSKHAYMQRIADYVRLGYHYHISGVVTVRKAPRLVAKFVERFDVDACHNRRHRHKSHGVANAMLLMHSPKSLHKEAECPIYWMLLFTDSRDGALSLNRVEQLTHQRPQDALTREGRIQLTGYELVRLAKPLKERDPSGALTKTGGKEV